MKYFKYSTGTRNEGEVGSWKLYHRDNFTAHSAWNAHVKSHATDFEFTIEIIQHGEKQKSHDEEPASK